MKVTYNYTKKNKETRTIVTDDTKKLFAPNIAPTHCVVYDIESHGWKTLIKANINKKKCHWMSSKQIESNDWMKMKKRMNEYCFRIISEIGNTSPRLLRCRVCRDELGTNINCDYCEHKRDEAQSNLL